jgi:glucokinase
MYSIGVDIGGSFIKCGIVKDGKLLAKDKVPTIKENNESKIIESISTMIDNLLGLKKIDAANISHIGIGMAGSCDKGVCLFMANTEWRNVRLAKLLNKKYGCPVKVVNDLKSATLGELNFGIGKKCKDFVFVGLGTGVNCGIVKGDYVIDGVEFGHIIIDRDGEPCGCGKNGCLESFVSAKRLLEYGKKASKEKIENIRELFEKAKTNTNIQKAINHYLNALNIGLINICNSYRPEVIVLGGGIGEGLKDYIGNINKKLEDANYGYPTARKTKVVVSKVGNDCGVLGASTLK